MSEKIYMVPNPPTPNRAVAFNSHVCLGCNSCVDVCPTDVLMPNPEPGNPPIVLYPEECWYCAVALKNAPVPGAITMLASDQSENLDELETQDPAESCSGSA